MKINKIRMDRFRGHSAEYELGQRTFITGPNGSGKTTIMSAAHFAVKGKLPGYKSSEAYANAGNGYMMGGITVDGRTIDRTLTQGKTLSEKLIIDGEEMSAKAAEPILKVLLGKGPLLLDMPAFYECSAKQMRQMVLGLVAGKDEQKAIMDATDKARTNKNEATADRRAAEKALEVTTQELAEMERPVGSVKGLQEEEGKLNDAIDELNSKISRGTANDRMREQYEASAKAVPENQKALAEAQQGLKAIMDTLKSLDDEDAKDQEPKAPEGAEPLSTAQGDAIQQAIDIIKDNSTSGPIDEAVEILSDLFPDKEAQAQWEKNHSEWNMRAIDRDKAREEAMGSRRNLERGIEQLESNIKDGEECKTKMAQIGPGSDAEDIPMLAGMKDRRQELRERISQLQKVETLENLLESQRIEIEKAGERENASKENQENAIKRQAKVINAAVATLSERSKALLPEGQMEIRDDGKNFEIVWLRENGQETTRTTLSGGEQCLFDAALGHSLAPEAAVFIEGGEIDSKNLQDAFIRLQDCDFQIIVASWNDPYHNDPEHTMPDGWETIRIS